MIIVGNERTQIIGKGKDVLNEFCNVVRAIYVSMSKTDGAQKAETSIRELVDMTIKKEREKSGSEKQGEGQENMGLTINDLLIAHLATLFGGLDHDTD